MLDTPGHLLKISMLLLPVPKDLEFEELDLGVVVQRLLVIAIVLVLFRRDIGFFVLFLVLRAGVVIVASVLAVSGLLLLFLLWFEVQIKHILQCLLLREGHRTIGALLLITKLACRRVERSLLRINDLERIAGLVLSLPAAQEIVVLRVFQEGAEYLLKGVFMCHGFYFLLGLVGEVEPQILEDLKVHLLQVPVYIEPNNPLEAVTTLPLIVRVLTLLQPSIAHRHLHPIPGQPIIKVIVHAQTLMPVICSST